MRRELKAVRFVTLLMTATGCAGTNWVRPHDDSLQLGRTTYAEVVKLVGEPSSTKELQKEGRKVILAAYAPMTGGVPLERGVTPARALAFHFCDGVLVARGFSSSFRSDHTNFDETKVPAIVKGKTTRAEVVQLLGRPSGDAIPPMVRQPFAGSISYRYIASSTTSSIGMQGGGTGVSFHHAAHGKTLTVSFDADGVVQDLDYEQVK